MIQPNTRFVWYFPNPGEIAGYTPGEPLTAIVVKTNDDGTVNLVVFDKGGSVYRATNVAVLAGDAKSDERHATEQVAESAAEPKHDTKKRGAKNRRE